MREARSSKSSAAKARDAEGARDAQKQETYEALIRAGKDLFSEQGLDAPSLDAICARAGFTRGAFYVHFADREAFIVAVMERAIDVFLDSILKVGGEAADLDQVVTAFAALASSGGFSAFGEVPPHQLLAACARSRALRERYIARLDEASDRLAATIRAGQSTGKARGDVDAPAMAKLLVAIALGAEVMNDLRAPFDAKAMGEAVLAMSAPPRQKK